ncbi:MAG TPA: sigma-70 family RNA polymerase sigma factor [Nannocystaceae bacterium]|nr:sigma-70 family RNA polymerase sigma factor [Nannocystaceae bacterium]
MTIASQHVDAAERSESEPHVLDVLVASHREFLGFLERRLGDREVAEDILQSAFVRAAQRISQLRDDESIVAWFYRMLRNAVADHHRAHGRATAKLDALARELGDGAEPAPDTHAAVCRCVGELLDTLKPEYADVLREVELAGTAVKDYAAAVDITPNNAGVRLFRAREALRNRVARCCGTCATHGCVDCTCG